MDKVYGPETTAVVKVFQKGDGLPTTGQVDGITMARVLQYVPGGVDPLSHNHNSRYAATVHTHPYADDNHGHATKGHTE